MEEVVWIPLVLGTCLRALGTSFGVGVSVYYTKAEKSKGTKMFTSVFGKVFSSVRVFREGGWRRVQFYSKAKMPTKYLSCQELSSTAAAISFIFHHRHRRRDLGWLREKSGCGGGGSVILAGTTWRRSGYYDTIFIFLHAVCFIRDTFMRDRQ